MTTRLTIPATLALGVLALGGCKKADTAATDAATTTAATPAVATAAPSGFAAGKWSMTAEITDVQAKGASPADETEIAQVRAALKGKPSTQEVCVSQADVDGGLEKLFVTPGADCTTDSKQITGGTITAAYTCKTQSGGSASIKTAGGYTADTMTTMTAIETPGPKAGTAMNLTAKTTGKRVGAC